jgi:myo-inositol-1(or 4)-monophosphatase
LPALDNPAADLALLEESVREAGKIARSFFGGTYKRWDKGKGNPVTEADLAIDRFLAGNLRAARPEFGWLSEETEDDASRLTARAVFVVDPIDGTVAFMKGRPHFTICAGIVCDGIPVAGAVYNPITEESFTARAQGGAFLNGNPIFVSSQRQVEGCRMLGDKPMFEHAAWNNSPNVPWPPMQIETRNSIAYRMALVATGRFDAMMALSAKHDWDLAAAEIIVREAGGIVTAHTGSRFSYNGRSTLQPSVVAAGPILHAQLLTRVSHLKLSRA